MPIDPWQPRPMTQVDHSREGVVVGRMWRLLARAEQLLLCCLLAMIGVVAIAELGVIALVLCLGSLYPSTTRGQAAQTQEEGERR